MLSGVIYMVFITTAHEAIRQRDGRPEQPDEGLLRHVDDMSYPSGGRRRLGRRPAGRVLRSAGCQRRR